MYLDGADYFVRKVDMPHGIHGSVSPNDDGTFSVYINARDAWDRQQRAYQHEVNHIESDDFYSGKDVSEIES